MKASLYNLQGKETGTVELSDAIFARAWNADLVHQVTVAHEANLRRPWAHAKGRGEVRGGGIKPWKQKGTGRARHGSSRSPIWKGGGASHGPTKDRDFSQKVNKKMMRASLYSVLSKKLADGEIKFVDSLEMKEAKTKNVVSAVRALITGKTSPSVLFVSATGNKMFNRAARNIPRSFTLNGSAINTHDAIKFKHLIIEQKALAEIK